MIPVSWSLASKLFGSGSGVKDTLHRDELTRSSADHVMTKNRRYFILPLKSLLPIKQYGTLDSHIQCRQFSYASAGPSLIAAQLLRLLWPACPSP
jgi:hypothetical protein